MKRQLSLLGFVVLLVSCGAATVEPPPPCSSLAPSGTLGIACTPPQPTVGPVGSWAGTLTTTVGGSGSQPFTAEISASASSSSAYTGVFTVGDTVYNVTGNYSVTSNEGEEFGFMSPAAELGPELSPAPFSGLSWYGPLTETTYSGVWTREEADVVVASGTFTLERRP